MRRLVLVERRARRPGKSATQTNGPRFFLVLKNLPNSRHCFDTVLDRKDFRPVGNSAVAICEVYIGGDDRLTEVSMDNGR